MPDPSEVHEPQAPWNPPTGDLSFDDIFASDAEGRLVEPSIEAAPETLETPEAAPAPQEPEVQPSVTTTPQGTPSPAAKTVQDEFFVATYRTKEAAQQAITEKDRLIDDLRAKVIAIAGVDPLNRRSAAEPQASQSYLNNPSRYAKDLTDAATSGKYDNYVRAQAQLVDELIQTKYGHILPRVEKLGRQEAVDSVASQNPAFREFYGSEDYHKALDRHPKLKEAIQTAEGRPDLQADYLPDMYQTVWDVSVGLKASELVNGGPKAPPTQSTPRMPMTPSSRPSLNVPDNRSPQAGHSGPDLSTSAGRKALIADMESRGIKDRVF